MESDEMKTPILEILTRENEQVKFFADGTSSGLPEGMRVVNYIPLLDRRIDEFIHDLRQDYGLPVNG